MKPTHIVSLVVGSLLAVAGFATLVAAAVLGWAMATQRDDAGYFTTGPMALATDSYALTSDVIDLGQAGPRGGDNLDRATVRIDADSPRNRDVFVGIGPDAAVEAYLADVPHDEITDINGLGRSADVTYRQENTGGRAAPTDPAAQTFWVASSAGAGHQELIWEAEPGSWSVVIMNADATPTVTAEVDLGGRIDHLLAATLGLAGGATLALAAGVALILFGAARSARNPTPPAPALLPAAGPPPGPAGPPYPLTIEGRLDPALSRWLWLVKWFLAIPHYLVLAFLWVAFTVVTLVAFFAILITGRYPRSLFEFNVGVLRWSWRVGYYSTSVLGTDRYPPFTLAAADYPATLELAYPEHLSRGLVLVKSWLLALPHLVIVGVLTAGWSVGDDNTGAQTVFSGGLLGVLVLVAGVILLVTNRYPPRLHELIMGINRWIYRVVVYVALMTDRYPPFHLDQGGTEPVDNPGPGPGAGSGTTPETPRRYEYAQ